MLPTRAHARRCEQPMLDIRAQMQLIPYSLQETHEAAQVQPESTDSSSTHPSSLTPTSFADKISYAFQLATAQGPMCHEPMQGVAVFLEEVTVAAPSDEEAPARDQLGRLTGEVIKTVRDSIRQGFMDWSPRLMLAMYSCEIQASSKTTPHSPLKR